MCLCRPRNAPYLSGNVYAHYTVSPGSLPTQVIHCPPYLRPMAVSQGANHHRVCCRQVGQYFFNSSFAPLPILKRTM